MFWVKPTTGDAQDVLYFYETNKTVSIHFAISWNYRIYMKDIYKFDNPFQVDTWTYLATTQSDIHIVVYVDGQIVPEQSQSTPIIITSTCYFGSNGFPLLANMDDVMFFDRVLKCF